MITDHHELFLNDAQLSNIIIDHIATSCTVQMDEQVPMWQIVQLSTKASKFACREAIYRHDISLYLLWWFAMQIFLVFLNLNRDLSCCIIILECREDIKMEKTRTL